MPGPFLIAEAAHLPSTAGLLLFHVAAGAFGGIAAAAHFAGATRPPCWEVVKRLIVGLCLGFAGGCAGMSWIGTDEAAFYRTLFICFVCGFGGPAIAFKILPKGALKG